MKKILSMLFVFLLPFAIAKAGREDFEQDEKQPLIQKTNSEVWVRLSSDNEKKTFMKLSFFFKDMKDFMQRTSKLLGISEPVVRITLTMDTIKNKDIITILKTFKALEILKVDSRLLTNKGIKTIKTTLQKNSTLQTIEINGVSLKDNKKE
jgi:predicted permease